MPAALGDTLQNVGDSAWRTNLHPVQSRAAPWAQANGGDVLLGEVATGTVRQVFGSHFQPVMGVVFSADGRRLATRDLGGTVKRGATARPREPAVYRPGAVGNGAPVAYSPRP